VRLLDSLDRRGLFPGWHLPGRLLRLRGQKPEVTAQPIGYVIIERAGVGPLVSDTELRQQLQKPGRLHLQLPS
jgi:hypothetical protein